MCVLDRTIPDVVRLMDPRADVNDGANHDALNSQRGDEGSIVIHCVNYHATSDEERNAAVST